MTPGSLNISQNHTASQKKIADFLYSKEDMVEIELYTTERYEVEEYYVVNIG